jgi:hypothetical protein
MAKKLSIYLADDLWEAAQRLGTPKGEKSNASAIVQRALELMLREREARTAALAAEASLDRERFDAIVNRVRAGARAEFERGYASGLELVELVGFDGLSEIIQWGSIDDCDGIWDDPEHYGCAPWTKEHEYKFEQDAQYEAFRAGANKAVREVWDAVRGDNWGVTPATPPTAEENPDDSADGRS